MKGGSDKLTITHNDFRIKNVTGKNYLGMCDNDGTIVFCNYNYFDVDTQLPMNPLFSRTGIIRSFNINHLGVFTNMPQSTSIRKISENAQLTRKDKLVLIDANKPITIMLPKLYNDEDGALMFTLKNTADSHIHRIEAAELIIGLNILQNKLEITCYNKKWFTI